MTSFQIKKAEKADFTILTEIAFAAKKHWNYPDAYYKLWEEELRITKAYVQQHLVYKAMLNDLIVGFYSIVANQTDFYAGEVFVSKGFWLEHIFIHPDFHKKGFGKQLIHHAIGIAQEKDIQELLIFVDPNAKGFYDKTGAVFMYDSKSSIPGRLIPVYTLKTN